MDLIAVRVGRIEVAVQDVDLVLDLFVGDVLLATQVQHVENHRDAVHLVAVLACTGAVGDQLVQLMLELGFAQQIAGVRGDQACALLVGAAEHLLAHGQGGEGGYGKAGEYRTFHRGPRGLLVSGSVQGGRKIGAGCNARNTARRGIVQAFPFHRHQVRVQALVGLGAGAYGWHITAIVGPVKNADNLALG